MHPISLVPYLGGAAAPALEVANALWLLLILGIGFPFAFVAQRPKP